jgi:predicted GIY-YIG superfamily endonuclease
MKYVYLLQSLSVPTQRYVGVTTNLEERLQAHNAGGSLYTSKYRPWKVVMYLCFQDDQRAVDFERYLKTGSGQAFANKRLWYVLGATSRTRAKDR